MKKPNILLPGKPAGYTLIEVVVSAGILLIGVAAAASLSLAMITQEETNHRVARCLALNEGAAQLFRLGLEPSEVTALLPADPAVATLTVTKSTVAIPGAGNVEQGNCSVVINSTSGGSTTWTSGKWTGGADSIPPQRTHTVDALRPSMN